MSYTELIAPIPVPENNEVTNAEVQKIADWLRQNAILVLRESRLAKDTDPLAVGPRPNKRTAEDAGNPINDYTTFPGLNTVSADVVDANGALFCTHGVILPTTDFQNFGKVSDLETIVIRTGSLKYKIDQTSGVAGAGAVVCVETGQQLEVQSEAPTDYTCFYGQSGRGHVLQSLKQ